MKHLYPYLRRFRKESILAPLFKMLEATFDLLVPMVVADLIPAGDLADRNSLSRPGHCQRHHKTSLLCKTLLPLGSVLWLAFANLLSVL